MATPKRISRQLLKERLIMTLNLLNTIFENIFLISNSIALHYEALRLAPGTDLLAALFAVEHHTTGGTDLVRLMLVTMDS